jgi:hypothetical protein
LGDRVTFVAQQFADQKADLGIIVNDEYRHRAPSCVRIGCGGNLPEQSQAASRATRHAHIYAEARSQADQAPAGFLLTVL